MKKINKHKFYSEIKAEFTIFIGIFLSAFGLKSFLIPSGFLDGGVTGIALLIHFLIPLNFSLLLFFLNFPFILLAKKQISKIFAIKTFISIFLLSIILEFIHFPIITTDKLLVSVFGGFFVGAGIGMSVRGGSVLDGTEIFSVYLNKKTGFSVGEIIFIINVIIFSVAGFLLGIEVALYSMITYLVASKTVDFVSEGLEDYKGLTIISDKSEQIRKLLIEKLGLGVTIYKGQKGNLHEEKKIDILFTVITRLEMFRIKKNILAIDPLALLIEQNVHDFYGGFIHKRKPKIIK